MRMLLLALALLSLTLPVRAQIHTLNIVGQESIPPKWVMVGKHHEGVCPEILEAITRIEPRLQFRRQNEARSVLVMERGVSTGDIDLMCALIDTPLRRKIAVQVGPPVYQIRQRVAARADDPAVVNGYEDLVKLNALVNTSRGAGYVEQLRAHGLQVDDSSGDNLVNLRKIVAGHGRFMVLNELTYGYLLAGSGLEAKLKLMPAVLKEEAAYFWMSRKSDPAALKLLEAALNKLQQNGELARIYARWAHTKP